MASQEVGGKTSRLAQMQMRFQQKQQQEKEQRRLELAESKKLTETETVRSALSTVKSNNIGNGKVRQMFDERRRGAGIDRSNPLKPITTSSKSMSTPTLVNNKSSNSRLHGVRSQEAVAAQATSKTLRKSVPNKQAHSNRSTHSLLISRSDRERNNNNNAFSPSSYNGLDDIDNETTPRGFYTDGDNINNNNDSNNNRSNNMKKGLSNVKSSTIKLNPVLTKKSPPVERTSSTRSVNSSHKAPSRKSSGSIQHPVKLETTSSARTVTNKTSVAVVGRSQPPSARQPSAASTPRSPSTPRSGPPPEGMVQCKICGRNFNDDRIAKHEEACQKLANSKRKVFDASKHRIKGRGKWGCYTHGEDVSRSSTGYPIIFLKQYHKKKPSPNSRTANNPAANRSSHYISAASASGQTIAPKKSNWRRKHEEFIEAIRAAKKVQAHLARGGKLSDLPPPPPSENPDYIQCPHCLRRFNQAAAERHIPKCATMLHNKPKPAATTQQRK